MKILNEVKLWDKGFVQLVDSSRFNANNEGRLEALQLARVCVNKVGTGSKNAQALADRLAKEGTKDNPYSRSYELIPLKIRGMNDEEIVGIVSVKEPAAITVLRFSYCDADKVISTTLRNISNVVGTDKGLACKKFNTPEEVVDFKVVIAKIPYFVFGHLKTHNMLTTIAQSDRYSTEEDFWIPTDLRSRVYNLKLDSAEFKAPHMAAVYSFVTRFKEDCFDTIDLLKDLNFNEFETLFKKLGYTKEIYQRQLAGFRYKTVVIAGWKNDPLTWDHLFELRTSSHTQETTREFVTGLVELFEGREVGCE